MGISKRLALVVSGAAFAGGAALMLGAAPAQAAAPPASAPATGTHVVNHLFGCGCWDDCDDDWDDWGW